MSARALRHLRGNVVAYLALFVALTGTAVAATALPKNSVGTKQLRKAAVTGKKVKKNTLGGRQVNEAKLGIVPLAAKATTADTATSANSATTAATATKAGDADTVGGQSASAFLAKGDKAVDADKLDGVDSAVFGDTVIVAGSNFEPRDSTATEKAYQGTGSISCTGGSASDFHYRLDLPQGARITSVDWRYVDNAAAANPSLSLTTFNVMDLAGPLTDDVVTLGQNRDDPDETTLSKAPDEPFTVDNAHHALILVWSPVICDSESQLRGAAVHYELPR